MDLLSELRRRQLFGLSEPSLMTDDINNQMPIRQMAPERPREISSFPDPYGGQFDPAPIRMAPVTSVAPMSDDNMSIEQLYNSIYRPERKYSDMYDKTLAELPTQDHNHSIWRKIGASIVGATGDKQAQEDFLHGGTNRKRAEVEGKLKAIEPAMRDERMANAQERASAADITSRTISDRKAERDAKRLDARLELDQKKNAQIYETKLKQLEQDALQKEARLELAERTLQMRQGDADADRALRQATLDATNARHALDLARRDRALDQSKEVSDARANAIKKAAEDAGFSIREETISEDGSTKVIIEKKGEAGKAAVQRVKVVGPNGQKGTVTVEDSKSLPPGWRVVQ